MRKFAGIRRVEKKQTSLNVKIGTQERVNGVEVGPCECARPGTFVVRTSGMTRPARDGFYTITLDPAKGWIIQP